MFTFFGSNFLNALYNFFHMIDTKLCLFWMKLTNRGRASYFIVLTFVYMVLLTVDNIWDPSKLNTIFSILILVLYFFVGWIYLSWLKNPRLGLRSVKINGMYFNTSQMEAFVVVTALTIITIPFTFFDIDNIFELIADILLDFWGLLYFCAITHSGPPKPDNTFWQQVKSKVKHLLESNRKPVLIPSPIGTSRGHYKTNISSNSRV